MNLSVSGLIFFAVSGGIQQGSALVGRGVFSAKPTFAPTALSCRRLEFFPTFLLSWQQVGLRRGQKRHQSGQGVFFERYTSPIHLHSGGTA